MKTGSTFEKIEQRIALNEKLVFTAVSYVAILIMIVNLNQFQSLVLGLLASAIYFLINGVFLGHVFFKREPLFFRLMFGLLLLIMLLGFVGWLAIVIHDLGVINFILVLLIVATISSTLNKMVNKEYGI